MARKSRKQTAALSGGAALGRSAPVKLGLYARLSNEDNGGKGKDSIENQLALLDRFAEKIEQAEIISTYVDNGWTGTDLHRPQWERLMEDVRAKKIDCILVKDLSRFVRDHLEAGDYLEKIFPFLGVRFIAVNDQYDSAGELFSEKDLVVEFKNLANDYYSRDISKKILSAFQAKKSQGLFIGNKAPYGYILKNGHFVIDEPAAEVVRRIFAMRMEGVSFYRIAKRLDQDGVPSPSSYAKGRGVERYKDSPQILWQPQAVSRIAHDRTYVGDLVQGKYDRSIYSTKGQKKRKEEDWDVTRDAHRAIIEREVFERVQEMRRTDQGAWSGKKRGPAYENVLQGILVCGTCGRLMRRTKEVRRGRTRYYFYCASAYDRPWEGCSRSCIVDHKIFDLVLEQVRLQVDLAVEAEAFRKRMERAGAAPDQHIRQKEELARAKGELERCIYQKMDLYRQMKQGILTKERFLEEKEGYALQVKSLKKEIEEQQQAIEALERSIHLEDRWLNAFLAFRDAKELTRDMAVELLEKVQVYGDERVHIRFKFRDGHGDRMS